MQGENVLWCSTKVDYITRKHVYGHWGTCGSGCPDQQGMLKCHLKIACNT